MAFNQDIPTGFYGKFSVVNTVPLDLTEYTPQMLTDAQKMNVQTNMGFDVNDPCGFGRGLFRHFDNIIVVYFIWPNHTDSEIIAFISNHPVSDFDNGLIGSLINMYEDVYVNGNHRNHGDNQIHDSELFSDFTANLDVVGDIYNDNDIAE